MMMKFAQCSDALRMIWTQHCLISPQLSKPDFLVSLSPLLNICEDGKEEKKKKNS